MSVTYIFCESYVQLENTLFVVEKNYRSGEPSVVVIEENADLRKLFVFLRQSRYGPLLDIIYLPYIKPIGAGLKNRMRHLIKKCLKEKRYLDAAFCQHFKDVKGATIYFFCRPYNPYTFYMLKHLVKYNHLIYVYAADKEDREPKDLRRDSLSILLKKIWLKLIYGKGIKWRKFSHGAISTYIEDSFMAKVDQHITCGERKQWLKGFTLKDLSFVDEDNYHVVFYDTPYDPNISNKDDYCRTIEDIFTVLLKYFNKEQILIKGHPSSEKSMDLSVYGRVMPDFIPGEWFQKEGVLLFGFYSSACIFNASAGCPVSLEKLFKYKDQNIKDCMRRFVSEIATCDVLFPETLEDFEEIVEGKARNVD